MARWLRDAETGELFREDELDAGSYDQITDFQPIVPTESEAPQYEFPTWLTSGLGTSIPARTVASVVGGGSAINELLGDLAANIPGLEDNFLQRSGREGQEVAEVLVEQARKDNQIAPGSFQDVAGSVVGEVIPSLGTLGYGLLRGAGKAALSVAPTLSQSARKYTDLTDKGVSGADAGLAAAESLVLNSLLNRADVGTALNALSSPAKRIGQTALVGGATNAAGTYGDALIDKQVGAPQTRDEFLTNVLTSTGAGIGTGAGFGAMGALGAMRPRGGGAAPDMPVFSADDMLSRMAADAPPPPQPDTPTLGLPDSANKPVALLPMDDRSWVPETYQPGQDFLFRDFGAMPPMDPSRPQQALSSLPPEPLNWTFNQLDPVGQSRVVPEQPLMLDYDAPRSPLSSIPPEPLSWTYRQLDPGERVFVPDEPLQIGFDGFPQSQMPDWEVSPTYRRGVDFQYRDYGAPPPALLDPQATAIERETATSVSKVKPPVQSDSVQRIDESTSFPSVPKAPEVQAQGSQQDMFAAPPVQDSTPILRPSSAVEGLPVVEVPVSRLRLSAEVPQFKGGADERGVVEPLQGNFDRRGLAPLQVWERLDGSLEVISGRHRLDLAQRTNQETVPVQIYREADGFSARDAAILDAELNIRDENGSIQDYANYFRSSGIDQATAEARGLLSRSKGILGFNIGAKSTPELFSLYQNGKLSDRQAATIADAAPGNQAVQQVGIQAALKGDSLDEIRNALFDLKDTYKNLPVSEQTDMFGFDDRAIRLARARGAVATQLQNDIAQDLAAIRGAAKRPERASKLGVDVNDPIAVRAKAEALAVEQARLQEWNLYPDLKAKIHAQADLDLQTGNGQRKKTAQRITNKRRAPVASSEAGFIDISWIADLLGNKKLQKDLPDYKDVSDTNKRYAKLWPSMVEWMDTTRKKAPQSAGFIDAHWKIPQDLNSIVYDAKLTLEPYLGLTAQERAPVDSYLAAARVMGARDPSYKVTPQTAAKMGLTPKQAEAAISVNKWSGEMLNLLEDHAIRVAEHDATKKGSTLEPEKITEIRTRFDELRNSNYVPFNRYGEHYVNVFDKDGNLAYRYQFEKKSDPELAKTIRHFKQLISENGTEVSGGRVQYGKADPTPLNERDGVPSDILEMLNDNGAQGEIRGFYKHLKPAALVKGFNPDMLRNISEYTTGAAKLISLQRARMAGEVELVGSLRGSDNINLTKKLTAWAQGFNEKTSPAFQALNSAFNVAYIGGNLRTPTADMLGRIQLQYPLMSKYLKGMEPEAVFAKGVGKEVKWWFSSDDKFAKSDPALSTGIKEAQRKGIIPTNIYKTFLRNARGESQGASAFKNKVHDLYFGLKEISERSTDLGGFILGWEMYPRYMQGKGAGKDTRSRQQFAEDFVRESRAVPSQGELPAVFKSKTARLVTKYRLYQAKILKSLIGAGWGQWARYLAATGFTTGVVGLPFMRDSFNAARFGGVEPEDKLREMGAGSAVMYGPMSALAGIDFSGSAGFGEIFSGSGGNVASKFMLGMAGAPFEAATRAFNYYERGQNNKAIGALPFMPNAVSNFLTQKDWGERGVATLGGKAVIPRDEVESIDRIKKLLGYQPLRVKEAMVLENRKKQAANTGRATGFYNQRVGEALGLGNIEEAQALIQQAQEEGVKLNTNSIKEYRAKIQGRDGKIPKRARSEVQRVEQLYGNALRD